MSEATTLGQVLAEHGGSIKTGPFGTVLKAAEYSPEGVPVISVREVGRGSLRVHLQTPRVSPETAERLSEYVLLSGDVVFGRKGAVDRSAWVKQSENGYFLGSDGIRVRFAGRCDSRFMAYQLQTEVSRNWLLQQAAGTTMPSLNQRVLESLPIKLPRLNVQQAIAEVLGALDDKIAANDLIVTKIRDLLRARYELLRLSDEPDRTLADLVELNPAIPRSAAVEPPYLDMKNLPDSAMTVSGWSNRRAKGGARFENGDTLLARITPCLENGKVGFIDFLATGEVGFGSTEFIVMRARPGVPRVLPYFLASSGVFREYAIKHMTGTSGRQRLAAASVGMYPIRQPSSDSLDRFDQFSRPLMARLKCAVDETRLLAATRDELLPLLMSGRLHVKDAEKVVAEVV